MSVGRVINQFSLSLFVLCYCLLVSINFIQLLLRKHVFVFHYLFILLLLKSNPELSCIYTTTTYCISSPQQTPRMSLGWTWEYDVKHMTLLPYLVSLCHAIFASPCDRLCFFGHQKDTLCLLSIMLPSCSLETKQGEIVDERTKGCLEWHYIFSCQDATWEREKWQTIKRLCFSKQNMTLLAVLIRVMSLAWDNLFIIPTLTCLGSLATA